MIAASRHPNRLTTDAKTWVRCYSTGPYGVRKALDRQCISSPWSPKEMLRHMDDTDNAATAEELWRSCASSLCRMRWVSVCFFSTSLLSVQNRCLLRLQGGSDGCGLRHWLFY